MVDNETWLKCSVVSGGNQGRQQVPGGILVTEVKAESKKVCKWI